MSVKALPYSAETVTGAGSIVPFAPALGVIRYDTNTWVFLFVGGIFLGLSSVQMAREWEMSRYPVCC